MLMTSCVNVCDVKSAEKRYARKKIVNNKTKMNMTCLLSHQCQSPVVRLLPLVLEVPGSIPARREKNFGVLTHFL